MRGLDDLVQAGKVLYIGVSNAAAWRIARSNTLAELRGWTAFSGLQTEYSLLERTAERELLPMAEELDLAVMAWSPLANGVLSGKYGAPQSQGRRGDRPLSERELGVASLVQEIARELGALRRQLP
jgi:aryl-alcohol dehydrogenase-like predicted oxidoreductase